MGIFVTKNGAMALIKENKGKFFGVSFTKKDGTHRDMVARLGVTRHLTGKGQKYSPQDHGLLTVFDVANKGYRNINLETLSQLRINGVVISVID